MIRELKKAAKVVERATLAAEKIYRAQIQKLVNKHGVELATGHLSDVWQIKVGDDWISEWDSAAEEYQFFRELKKLDEIASEMRLGPSNMERFTPQ